MRSRRVERHVSTGGSPDDANAYEYMCARAACVGFPGALLKSPRIRPDMFSILVCDRKGCGGLVGWVAVVGWGNGGGIVFPNQVGSAIERRMPGTDVALESGANSTLRVARRTAAKLVNVSEAWISPSRR